jgi:hypothetical protein
MNRLKVWGDFSSQSLAKAAGGVRTPREPSIPVVRFEKQRGSLVSKFPICSDRSIHAILESIEP